jgi:hypothetical protein
VNISTVQFGTAFYEKEAKTRSRTRADIPAAMEGLE